MAKQSDPELAALFVRLPVAQAEKLDRAAFELKVPKQQLVNALLERYSPEELARLPGLGAGRRRVVVESEFDDMAVGSHSFRPYEPAEVLSPGEAAELLQVDQSVVQELAEAGELPGRKIGGEWRFSRTAVLEWLGTAADETSAHPPDKEET
jgi:excisionase family DNA binding protein